MDPPHLLPLGLLLLALAAPHPNIAMSTVGTEGTEDYSTEVTVYRCRDCNSCTCKSGANDFENFNIIADTQNNRFSDVIIELVTNKTHTTVCFEEPNFCLEETYGIFWKRDGGSGLSCGILRSGENGRGGISAEKKTICCEAETGSRKNNSDLKCFYEKKSLSKRTKLPAVSPGEGIAGNCEVPTSETNGNCTCMDMALCWVIGIITGILLALFGVFIVWAVKTHRLQRCCQALRDRRWADSWNELSSRGCCGTAHARRRDRPVPRRENIPLNG
ncbi:uncharacterized protein LOC130260360 isoform X4 [Oenanthe melanoleuca]|uniref:uncharacterized protein LOC130260360 isoform X4 n=1 Tax=Oenanthe melanoleuca TaxID=2939378 RepID=UPI0024C1096B|nr:uncharacterized protein LOC130260360 isoform X4 [Oenanthe melanoleuca]XP_056361638.1 uncharacterized protein LOC130260360 isoform X4 [Oenanthe melanoleuca]